MNWGRLDRGSSALDTYLSTDDEEDVVLMHPKKACKGSKKEALQLAELSQAKRVAQRRMERQEIMEIERAFAVLDNVQERAVPPLRKNHYSRSNPQLNPRHNPFIENEAVEVGESDSDLADEESFDTLRSRSDADTAMDEEEDSKPSPPISQNQSLAAESDLSDVDDWPTLYENYSASRQLMEAQIQKEQMETNGYHSGSESTRSNDTDIQSGSDSTSSDSDQYSHSNTSDDGSDTSMEVEASFSSVSG